MRRGVGRKPGHSHIAPIAQEKNPWFVATSLDTSIRLHNHSCCHRLSVSHEQACSFSSSPGLQVPSSEKPQQLHSRDRDPRPLGAGGWRPLLQGPGALPSLASFISLGPGLTDADMPDYALPSRHPHPQPERLKVSVSLTFTTPTISVTRLSTELPL